MKFRSADLELDVFESAVLTDSGKVIRLTPIELKLMIIFCNNPPYQVFKREDLLIGIGVYSDNPRAVDAHIANLRSKLRGHTRTRIRARHGIGYYFEGHHAATQGSEDRLGKN